MNVKQIVVAIGLCAIVTAVYAAETVQKEKPWVDNERQFRSGDAQYNVRRSDHFRIMWGKGAAARPPENADFKNCTEQMAQGNLQMLDQMWHVYHDPEPAGIGFHVTGKSCKPEQNTNDALYRINLMMNNSGIWEGGAWGACDDWGYPLFALPPSYLSFDTPSGATPHEYGHTVLINAGGFNDTPYDGMWHEATANWLQLQFLDGYPGPGNIAMQPQLSVPHGRTYYDAWPIWEYFKDNPKFGYAFINKVWTQANGTKSKGGEYIFDAMVRLDTSGSTDSYNAIKDAVGTMAAQNITWDHYARRQFFQHSSARSVDPLSEKYRRGVTELVRRAGDKTWYRGPFAHAPEQNGYNVIPVALEGKTGANYKVTVNVKPLWDAVRKSDMRVTLVAVNRDNESRFSTMWNGGENSITLAADENELYLVVVATPDFMGFEGFSRPLMSDLPLQPQAYEVSFANPKNVFESKPAKPEKATGAAHSNGGGFVASSAKVEPTAYVGPNAMVLDNAQVQGKARIEDYAVVMNNAMVKDNARVSGHALVKDNAQIYDNGRVRDWATVMGGWKVYENGRALEHAWLLDRGELYGNGTIKGNVPDYGNAKVSGHAIKEGDCANGVPVSNQVLMCWVWGFDQKYADERPDNEELYACYQFKRESPIYAMDKHGIMHGYLMGGPKTVTLGDAAGMGALELNGKDQYVELKRDVADFVDTTIAVAVNWAGGAADQRIFSFGDGAKKYAYLTPKDAAGKVKFVISASGKSGEQVLTGPAALPVKAWSHVAVTLKGNVGTLYVDGKQVAVNNNMTLNPDDVLGPNSLAGDDCMFLGRGETGNYFSGMVTDFRVYLLPQETAKIAAVAGEMKSVGTAVAAAAKDDTPALSAVAFLMKPTVVGERAIAMSAPRIAGSNCYVEYCFVNTDDSKKTSGWISANRWTDCNLEPGKTYSYAFKLRGRDGKETALSASAGIELPKDAAAPVLAGFEYGPVGISTSAIRMVAKKAKDASCLVEYKFARNDGKSTGWQSSRTWVDKELTEGAKYTYTVQARDGWGNVSKPLAAAKAATVRDDAPPMQYTTGEWQSRPYATVSNGVSMRAMSVTGDGAPKIESGEVEYFFHCVTKNGPDSGWISQNSYATPPVKDGVYTYEFKMRDKSLQKNETPYSAPLSAKVTKLTGYHPSTVATLRNEPEGALVSFKGRVTAVESNAYTVTDGSGAIKVMPQTVASATDAAMKGKNVTVYGCVWMCDKEKRVTWAEVK